LEKEELTGFKANAEHIFFTTSYMLGLATLVDNNYKEGIKIWESLEAYLKDKSELSGYIDKVRQLKSTSYLLLSRLLYFQGQFDESLSYRNILLSIVPNEYDKYLTEAVRYVKLRNEPELALDFVKKAEKVAKKDGTWRYSKFYLLIKLNRCQEAVATLDEILKNSFSNEVDAINQVISFNNNCLNDDNNHFQSHFIIGVLAYKKLNLPIPAYEKLEIFANLCECNNVYKELCVRAKKYLSEIDKIIGIEQNK
jgi:tetratricopeptide (TPR) repeat protein